VVTQGEDRSRRKALLSVEEAAALLGVTRDTVYRAIKAKTLPVPVYVIGKRMRIPRLAIDRLLEGAVPPSRPATGTE
jgi:excisionase family DNA binding protein